MSSQQATNPASKQPPVDPRRAKGIPAKPGQGSGKAPHGLPGVQRKQGAPPTPAKPQKKKSDSWIDSITKALSCCSSKKEKSPQKGRRPMTKPPVAKPGVKPPGAKPGVKPGVRAAARPGLHVKGRPLGGAKSVESSSKSSVRPSKKPAPPVVSGKAKKATRVKGHKASESTSQSSRQVVPKKGPSKEKPKQESTTSASSRKVSIEKGPSKEKPKAESKEIINSKRSKEVATTDSPTKTARFWPVEDAPSLKLKPSGEEPSIKAPVVKDKAKKSVQKEKREMVPDSSEPLQSLQINRFVTGKRHVFRWTYEESFPLEDETVKDEEEVKKPEIKKVEEKEAKERPKAKVSDDDDDEPLEVYTFNIKPRPAHVLKLSSPAKSEPKKAEPKSEKTKKAKESKIPEIPVIPRRNKGEALCCSCCDCTGNRALMMQKKTN